MIYPRFNRRSLIKCQWRSIVWSYWWLPLNEMLNFQRLTARSIIQYQFFSLWLRKLKNFFFFCPFSRCFREAIDQHPTSVIFYLMCLGLDIYLYSCVCISFSFSTFQSNRKAKLKNREKCQLVLASEYTSWRKKLYKDRNFTLRWWITLLFFLLFSHNILKASPLFLSLSAAQMRNQLVGINHP